MWEDRNEDSYRNKPDPKFKVPTGQMSMHEGGPAAFPCAYYPLAKAILDQIYYVYLPRRFYEARLNTSAAVIACCGHP